VCKLLVGKLGEKKTLEIHRWEDNIKINLKETEWEDVSWIHLAQDRDQW
jgi:hypothetical protein